MCRKCHCDLTTGNVDGYNFFQVHGSISEMSQLWYGYNAMLAQTFQACYIKLLFTYTLTVIGMTHICLHVVLNLMRVSLVRDRQSII